MKLSKFVMMLVAGLMVLPFSCAVFSREGSAIVDVDWLSQHLSEQNLLLIDVRPAEAFETLHVQGAVNLPYERLFDENYFMPSLQQLQADFGRIGVDYDKTVVVMDDGDFIWAARLFWLLETLGHKDVRMLNVGFTDWITEVLPTSNQPVEPQPSTFVPSLDQRKLQTKLSTLVSIGQRRILDGREEPHYLGQQSTAQRFGHIPTAEHYPCTQNYESTAKGNQLHPLDVLASVYADLPKHEEIILYCGGGAESALNYIVLQELGYRVSIYDGSWQEWGNDPVLPIHNPTVSEP